MAFFTAHIIAKRLIKIAALWALIFSSYSAAIGMSDLTVSSAVGERFYGLITVTGAKDISTNDILVSLAPRSVYRAMGVEWEYFHTRLIFDVLVDEQNQYTIRVVSSDVVFEPYLDFVVSLRSPAGSISKQLTALLEMPAVIVKPTADSKQQKTVKATLPTVPPIKQLNKIQRTPITPKESLSSNIASIENHVETDAEAHVEAHVESDEEADEEAGVEAEVEIEVEVEVEEESSPVVLSTKADDAVKAFDDDAVKAFDDDAVKDFDDEASQVSLSQAKASESTSTHIKADQQDDQLSEPAANTETIKEDAWSHKTRSGDSLWAVARRIHAETGGNIKPIVDALYQNNSHAFIKNDADRLKVNARLAVTAAQISAVISAKRPSDNALKVESLVSQAVDFKPVDKPSVNEEGVLSLVTTDNNTAPVAAETVELSERSESLASDFDKGLSGSKERELNVEARMDNLYLQYEALSARTEQLRVLEESLNRSIADKSQLSLALDESLSTASEAVNTNENPPTNDATDRRPLLFILIAASTALLLLVLFLKHRQTQRRSRDVDNWSLEAEQPSDSDSMDNSQPDERLQSNESTQPNDSIQPNDSLHPDDGYLPSDTSQESSDLEEPLADDADINEEPVTATPLAIPAEGAVELEAAVYIAYERYDEAEDLLEQALEIDSDNQALQMQLLEVYAAKGKTRHFDLLANQINDDDNDRITIKINYLKSKI